MNEEIYRKFFTFVHDPFEIFFFYIRNDFLLLLIYYYIYQYNRSFLSIYTYLKCNFNTKSRMFN